MLKTLKLTAESSSTDVSKYIIYITDSNIDMKTEITLHYKTVEFLEVYETSIGILATIWNYSKLKQSVVSNVVRAYLCLFDDVEDIQPHWLETDALFIERIDPKINYTKKYLPCVIRQLGQKLNERMERERIQAPRH